MRSVTGIRLWLAVVLLIATVAPPRAAAQSKNEPLRGLFIKSRPTQPEGESQEAVEKTNLALGYTLVVRSSSGQPARVSSIHRFQSGDALRVVVEPNRNVYLYIFNREGDGPLRLIFPDLRIRRGDARVAAHVPLQIPQGDTNKDWFIISGEPTKEILFVVCSIEPVIGWPSGRDLLQHPVGFRLNLEEFKKATRSDANRIVEQSNVNDAVMLTADEQMSISRGLKLLRKDPPPVTIETSAANSGSLVVEVEIKRR